LKSHSTIHTSKSSIL